MGLFDALMKKIQNKNDAKEPVDQYYEFCPRCEANLTLQKGYSNDLPYWVCKGCGEMLVNPAIDDDDNISWICDRCEAMLNIQDGFSTDCGMWTCTECGYANKIDASEIYAFDDEYRASKNNPYKGLSDDAVLEISSYEEVSTIGDRDDIVLIKNVENNQLYVKKILKDYDISVYKYLLEHPITQMPRLIGLYEGTNNLVVIEEYIKGPTLLEVIHDGRIELDTAIYIAKELCGILSQLHHLESSIIHRDIKPSNVILSSNGLVYLLDINVAKWYKPEETEDTRMFGTLYYAAPEQFGYGFAASSEKTDIYSLGILINVMLTGKIPKEEKATGAIWNVIERCISLNPEQRYTADELMTALNAI